jgi:hypothetical protein
MSDLSDDAILIVTAGRFKEIISDLLKNEYQRALNEQRAHEKWRATNMALN